MAYKRKNYFTQQSYTSNTTCVIIWDASLSAYRIKLPSYNKQTVEFLKTLPSKKRSYDEDTKSWLVEEESFKLVELILKRFYSKVEVITKETIESYSQSAPSAINDYEKWLPSNYRGQILMNTLSPKQKALLAFIELFPLTELSRVYKIGATALHPDRDIKNAAELQEKSAQFNAAWTALNNILK